MNSLRIAIAASGLGHVARGVEAWAADLAQALHASGAAVTLYKGGGTPDRAYEAVLPCWQRGSERTRRLLRWLPRRFVWRFGLGTDYGVEQSTFALSLLRRLRRNPVDVVHVQDAHVARMLQGARRLGLIRNATILAHGTNEPWPYLARFPYLQHLAPWHLEQGRQAGCWRPEWTAIPNFIDTDLFRPGPSAAMRAELGIPADHVVVLTAAAIKRAHKRIDHLLTEFSQLLAQAPHQPVTLVVAGGEEADTPELIAQGHRLLGDRVRFLVRFPRLRMPELYRLADLFVLCSLREMMPIALLEATASGLPCLTHDHPILTWMTGTGGVALDMATPGHLAQTLRRLVDDAASRVRLGQHARAHCEDQFGRDRVVAQILDYYAHVGAHQRRQGPQQGSWHAPTASAAREVKQQQCVGEGGIQRSTPVSFIPNGHSEPAPTPCGFPSRSGRCDPRQS